MTEDEIQEIKRQNIALLEEKAKAEKEWHAEVRATLAAHTVQLTSINGSITVATSLHAECELLAARVKSIEDFKLRATGWMMGAFAVITLLWKAIDKVWK